VWFATTLETLPELLNVCQWMIFLVDVKLSERVAVHCDTALELKARILYQYFLAAVIPLSV
jgi:hypothetical protein